jgi:hypothetical protein
MMPFLVRTAYVLAILLFAAGGIQFFFGDKLSAIVFITSAIYIQFMVATYTEGKPTRS